MDSNDYLIRSLHKYQSTHSLGVISIFGSTHGHLQCDVIPSQDLMGQSVPFIVLSNARYNKNFEHDILMSTGLQVAVKTVIFITFIQLTLHKYRRG